MARILAFSFFPAYLPPRSGGEVRIFGFYEALSHKHDVTLLTSGELGGALQKLEHNARFREIRVPKGGEFAKVWAELAPDAGGGDLSGPCLAASASRPSALLDAYLEHYSAADLIIHDFPFTAPYDLFMGHDEKLRIYASHNVELDLYKVLHGDAKTRRIVEIVEHCERRLIRSADIVTGCSEGDISRFREIYGPISSTVVLPNGVGAFSPPTVALDSKRLVFIGSAHYPNQKAAALIRDVLAPGLVSHEFHIMGRCLEQGQPLRNLVSHGLVDDATKQRLFSGALASINPMMEGSGSSLKIPDLAANGVPLISTELGARGYELVAGVHYSLIDPEDVLASVRRALANPQQLAAQARAAADHFARNYTWPRLAGRFSEHLDQALAAKRARPSCPRLVALNDYDPFATVGGGCTRIRGLYEGLSETIRPIILTFGDGDEIVLREPFNGKGLAIAVPKTDEHQKRDADQAMEFHVSTADVVAMEMASTNPLLKSIFTAAASFTDIVVCDHPYMATLLTNEQTPFVYSSQNFETVLKRQLLEYHPRRDELLAKIEEIERFCVGCSDLVVAVSDSDAAAFAAEFDLLAPVVVVSNGAEDPQFPRESVPLLPGYNTCFLGSGHVPNFTAAKFLVEHVAPALPDVVFHIAGSVCDGLKPVSKNVTLHGRLSNSAKTLLLLSCDLALNPMTEGSGSNVKVADYLMHGLKVLSTPFGARGYDGIGAEDLETVAIDSFVAAIARLAREPASTTSRDDRKRRFADRFSMRAFGAGFAATLLEVIKPRPRALFVTYRYNFPARGGGEFYVNRLVDFLAKSGVAVDVLTPKVDNIVDSDRFASTYPRHSGPYPVPYGNPGIRIAKFETATQTGRLASLRHSWAQQPSFEKALYQQFEPEPGVTGLLWGWEYGSGEGRWTMDEFAIKTARAGRLRLRGHAPCSHYLVVRGKGGEPIFDDSVEGKFDISFEAPSGCLEFRLFHIGGQRPEDPRPLGLFVTVARLGKQSLLEAPALVPWPQQIEPSALFHALHNASLTTRSVADASLADLRGPFSPELESYLADYVRDYDLVITHNVVFRTTSQAVKAARRANVPSIVVPHAHFEDDYYHFPDVMACIRDATRSLVTPPTACDFLAQLGLENVAFLSPGIDADEAFTVEDEAAFAALYRRHDPFVLVAGRKAAAKGYRDVISAVAKLRGGEFPDLRVVMIGPDDDCVTLNEDFVDCFGMVDRSVLRGAYRACSVLANMSRSESFGIVLLEAGLAGRPVVANADCAAFVELVSDGKNGYLATPTNLADRLAAILSDRSSAKAMGKNGRKMAFDYSWDQIGAKFVQHCNEVMRKGRLLAK